MADLAGAPPIYVTAEWNFLPATVYKVKKAIVEKSAAKRGDGAASEDVAVGAEAADTGVVTTARESDSARSEANEEERRQRALDLVMETVEALLAERGDNTVWGSMVKQTLKRRQPGFNESYYGFRSFNALLEDAQTRGLIALTRDDKSGGFKVRLAERAE